MALGKKTLYYMVPINLVLWCYIGYKIYMWGKDEEYNIPEEKVLAPADLNKDSNNYQLVLNYPDPFLKEEPRNKPVRTNLSVNTKPQVNSVSKKNNIEVPNPPKDIKYLGLIQNKNSGVTTALISINGKSYIIKKGEVIEGINFESITTEIITAKIGKEKLTINKS